ncbi:MAG: WcaI family glycosyltransferase [Bacteroidia bacterium]|nr:WcaI family glycosyltransferase [Bacteroidia bacterium]
MNKNITLIGINYSPEDSAIGLYSSQKAEYLVERGYKVSVITGFPYYPQWKISEAYRSKGSYFKETINGVVVYRFKQYVPANPSFLKRLIHLSSFTLGSLLNLFKPSNPDIVIAIVPFTSSVMLGWFLKIFYGAKLWVHIQDFEFDAAIDSGLLSKKNSMISKPLFWVERFLLRRAHVVSTISNGMLDKLREKTGRKGYFLSNWLDTSKFNMDFNEKHPYLNSTNFKILYSGNIGAKQDWDFFFAFLEELKPLKDVEVIVVGEGAEQKNVKQRLDDFHLAKHYNLVPFEDLPLLLSSADLHILFQKDEVIDAVMPSKILGMMGSGRPSIITGNRKSEVRQIFEDSQGGYYFQNDQLQAILDVVKGLQADQELGDELGRKAKQFIMDRYSKETVLNGFVNELNNL